MAGGGGGGGSFNSGRDPRDIARQVLEQEQHLKGEAFQGELAGLFAELLGSYNSRDTELVRRRLDEMQAELGDLAEGAVDLIFGGSVAKHTYVDGLSDIDCLLVINDTTLEGKGPHAAIEEAAKALALKLSGKAIVSAGQLAVTVRYPDGMEIQLLPAVRTNAG